MGGTVDPETGEIIWTMRVSAAEQLAYYRSHPPRALSPLRVTPTEQLDWRFDGHGEPINSIFELACSCGSKLFNATCGVDSREDENLTSPPIGLECDACESAFVLFDPSEHGWDAVMCGGRFEDPEGFDDLCGNEVSSPHETVVRFEYASDSLGDPELTGREQDVFTWFTLLARDARTKRLEQLFEWECA
jgi:hypothetical protein